MASITKISSCGIDELKNLSGESHEGVVLSAVLAMKNLSGGYGKAYRDHATAQGLRIPLHLLYSYTENIEGAQDSGYALQGALLKEAIEQFKLGTVVETPAVINRLYHPDHKAKALIWTVDPEALIKWWEVNNPDKRFTPPDAVDDGVLCTECGFVHLRRNMKGAWTKWPPLKCQACDSSLAGVKS